MQAIGELEDVYFDFKNNTTKITFNLQSNEVDNVMKLKGLKLNVEAKQYRQPRSNTANAYFHVLCNEIAKKLNADNEETKISLNCSYGTLARDDEGNILGCKVPKGTDIRQFYKYSQFYKTDKDGCDCYKFYKETHTLNSKEMADLIAGTIQEALNLDLEVKPKEEIESMLKNWKPEV